MRYDQARRLQPGDRLHRGTHYNAGWLQVVKVTDRGVVVDQYYCGVCQGHRELLDWPWLVSEHETNPVTKL